MIPFKLQRICTLMQPEQGNEMEVEGVLNPAVARGPDGHLYIFPRMVAAGNYSRIGIAKVLFDAAGDPIGVQRMGIALEPEADYEKRPNGGGGCEDPRITFVAPLKCYVMAYTAYGPNGPRVAMATSTDLLSWERVGLVCFSPCGTVDFNGVDNKDAGFFPAALPSPHGHTSMAMLNRPLFPGTRPEEIVENDDVHESGQTKESIWISYFNLTEGKATSLKNARFTSHYCVAHPECTWENLKIGAGAPPILTKYGWLLVYHGVQEHENSRKDCPCYCYSAGVMILSAKHPQKVIYRSPQPVLRPELAEETIGIVGNVVFPTGIDSREDIGQPERIDVYYGMADNRIGVAKMHIPDQLPLDGQ